MYSDACVDSYSMFYAAASTQSICGGQPTLGFSNSVEDPAYANYYDGPQHIYWKKYFNCYAFALNRHNVKFDASKLASMQPAGWYTPANSPTT